MQTEHRGRPSVLSDCRITVASSEVSLPNSLTKGAQAANVPTSRANREARSRCRRSGRGLQGLSFHELQFQRQSESIHETFRATI